MSQTSRKWLSPKLKGLAREMRQEERLLNVMGCLQGWLSVKNLAQKTGYTPRQIQRIMRRGPPKKLENYCVPEVLPWIFSEAFKRRRIGTGRNLRFKNSLALHYVCLWLRLHKKGISLQQHLAAVSAERLIYSPFERKGDVFDADTFSRRYAGGARLRAAQGAAAQSEAHENWLEKRSEAAEELQERLKEAEEKCEAQADGKERREEQWREMERREQTRKYQDTSSHGL